MADVATAPYVQDEAVLDRVRSDDVARVRVYRYPATAAVLGRGGKPDVELELDTLADDGIPVLRRRGGGCAVVLDPGNLVVTVTLPLPGVGQVTSSFDAISRWLIAALDACGIAGVERRGVSDLVLDDRKIGGSCIYRTKDLLHYATTLLVDPDLDLMERYLAHPPREPEYRRGRQHRDFVTTLCACGLADDPDRLARRLDTEVQRRLPDLTRDMFEPGSPRTSALQSTRN
jgi:lipoate---protein ligase